MIALRKDRNPLFRNFEKEILVETERSKAVAIVKGIRIEIQGTRDKTQREIPRLGLVDDALEKSPCDAMPKIVRVHVHDPQRNMGLPNMEKTGTHNHAGF